MKFETDSVPKEIFNNLTSDEKILSVIKSTHRPQYFIYVKYIFLISWSGLIIFTFWSFLRILPDIIDNFMYLAFENAILSDGFLMLIFICSILIIFPFLFFRKGIWATDYNLIVTDKKIHIKLDQYYALDLDSILGIIFEGNETSEKPKTGSLTFYSSDLSKTQKNKIKLTNIPNPLENSKLLQSIVWYYGNGDKRLQVIKKDSDSNSSLAFQLNNTLYKRLEKNYKQYNILSLICLLGFVWGIILFFFGLLGLETINIPINNGNIDLLLLSSISFILFGLLFFLLFFIIKYFLKKVLVTSDMELEIKENEIIIEAKTNKLNLNFSEKMMVKLLRCRDFTQPSKKKVSLIGTLHIKANYKSSTGWKFGPIKSYLKLFEVFNLSLLNWKARKGLLFSLNYLERLKTPKDKYTIRSDLKQRKFLTEFEKKKLLKPITLSPELKQSIQNYVNPNENILFFYKPEIQIRKTLFKGFLGIISLILSFFVIFLNPFDSFMSSIILFMIFLLIGLFGILSLFTLHGLLFLKKSNYIFTDQKILIKYSEKILMTPYNNISLITPNKRNNIIQINLKQDLENNPFIRKAVITIPFNPNNKKLIQQIRFLQKKYNN